MHCKMQREPDRLKCTNQDPAAEQGGPSIHLSYLSGWTRAFVHCNVDGQGKPEQQLCNTL